MLLENYQKLWIPMYQINHVAPSSLIFYLHIRGIELLHLAFYIILQCLEIALELMPIVIDSSTIHGLHISSRR